MHDFISLLVCLFTCISGQFIPLRARILQQQSAQSRTQSPQALWPAVISQERFWRIGDFVLIGCIITACTVLPQKSCINEIKVPQSVSWWPSADQKTLRIVCTKLPSAVFTIRGMIFRTDYYSREVIMWKRPLWRAKAGKDMKRV